MRFRIMQKYSKNGTSLPDEEGQETKGGGRCNRRLTD